MIGTHVNDRTREYDSSAKNARGSRKCSIVKQRDFDGSTPVEAFVQQIKTMANFNEWSDDERSIHLCCAPTCNAAMMIWSHLIQIVSHISSCNVYWEKGTAVKSMKKHFQTELDARVRKPNEDFPSLRAHITILIALSYSGGRLAVKPDDGARLLVSSTWWSGNRG